MANVASNAATTIAPQMIVTLLLAHAVAKLEPIAVNASTSLSRSNGTPRKLMAKANAAFMKPMTISPELAVIVGKGPMPRSEVVKGLWAYIKKNGLQDAKNKRNINADAKLLDVFGKPQVTMFELAGIVGKHLS
mgnify:CR=1 FL=1